LKRRKDRCIFGEGLEKSQGDAFERTGGGVKGEKKESMGRMVRDEDRKDRGVGGGREPESEFCLQDKQGHDFYTYNVHTRGCVYS